MSKINLNCYFKQQQQQQNKKHNLLKIYMLWLEKT